MIAKPVDRMCEELALFSHNASCIKCPLVMRSQDSVTWHRCLSHTLHIVSRTTTGPCMTQLTEARTLQNPPLTATSLHSKQLNTNPDIKSLWTSLVLGTESSVPRGYIRFLSAHPYLSPKQTAHLAPSCYWNSLCPAWFSLSTSHCPDFKEELGISRLYWPAAISGEDCPGW